jgi:hypothetical protein
MHATAQFEPILQFNFSYDFEGLQAIFSRMGSLTNWNTVKFLANVIKYESGPKTLDK